jgi:hypothetical protein
MVWQAIGKWAVLATLALLRSLPIAAGVVALELDQYGLAALAFCYYIERLRDGEHNA